jgi:hypothetical protein
MPEPTPCRPTSDRNLLFGILALQMDFIGRDALIAAMNAWVLDKAKCLGAILQGQGALAEDERAALETLVDRHLSKHGGNAERSLASVGSAGAVGSVRDELRRLADPDLDASLAQVGAAPAAGGPDDDAGTTVDHVGDDDVAGTTADHAGDDDAPLCCSVRYRVLRPHTRGGLGEVFLAEDRELHREVAFKEIQKPYAHDPHSRGRFLLAAAGERRRGGDLPHREPLQQRRDAVEVVQVRVGRHPGHNRTMLHLYRGRPEGRGLTNLGLR